MTGSVVARCGEREGVRLVYQQDLSCATSQIPNACSASSYTPSIPNHTPSLSQQRRPHSPPSSVFINNELPFSSRFYRSAIRRRSHPRLTARAKFLLYRFEMRWKGVVRSHPAGIDIPNVPMLRRVCMTNKARCRGEARRRPDQDVEKHRSDNGQC
jgi:hypothetical protein